MEKDPPPPYSGAPPEGAVHPLPGFNVPANQPAQIYPQAHIPPGQAAYLPQQQGTTVIVNTAPPVFGPVPQPATCPYCHKQITTRLQTEAGSRTHLIALLLCLFGCVPCCLIPYCTDSCQNRNHYCPSCGAYLGIYQDSPPNRSF